MARQLLVQRQDDQIKQLFQEQYGERDADMIKLMAFRDALLFKHIEDMERQQPIKQIDPIECMQMQYRRFNLFVFLFFALPLLILTIFIGIKIITPRISGTPQQTNDCCGIEPETIAANFEYYNSCVWIWPPTAEVGINRQRINCVDYAGQFWGTAMSIDEEHCHIWYGDSYDRKESHLFVSYHGKFIEPKTGKPLDITKWDPKTFNILLNVYDYIMFVN